MNARVELPEARQVCPTTTLRLLAEGALLVDVREPAEVERAAFDVPGAVAIPLSQLERRFRELPRDRQLVIACAVGERSLKGTYFLTYQGYTQVATSKAACSSGRARAFRSRATSLRPAPAVAAAAAVEVCLHDVRQDVPPKMKRVRCEIVADTDEDDRRVALLHDKMRKAGTVFNTVAPGTNLTEMRRLCGEAQVTP